MPDGYLRERGPVWKPGATGVRERGPVWMTGATGLRERGPVWTTDANGLRERGPGPGQRIQAYRATAARDRAAFFSESKGEPPGEPSGTTVCSPAETQTRSWFWAGPMAMATSA